MKSPFFGLFAINERSSSVTREREVASSFDLNRETGTNSPVFIWNARASKVLVEALFFEIRFERIAT